MMVHVPIHRLPPELLDFSQKTMAQRAAQLPPHGRYQYRKTVTAMRRVFDDWWREAMLALMLIPEEEWGDENGE